MPLTNENIQSPELFGFDPTAVRHEIAVIAFWLSNDDGTQLPEGLRDVNPANAWEEYLILSTARSTGLACLNDKTTRLV